MLTAELIRGGTMDKIKIKECPADMIDAVKDIIETGNRYQMEIPGVGLVGLVPADEVELISRAEDILDVMEAKAAENDETYTLEEVKKELGFE